MKGSQVFTVMVEKPKKLVILYATQTGNALDAAERIGREAERRGCRITLCSMDEFDAVSLFLSVYYFIFLAFFLLHIKYWKVRNSLKSFILVSISFNW